MKGFLQSMEVAHPLKKDAQPFLLNLLGREGLQEVAVPECL